MEAIIFHTTLISSGVNLAAFKAVLTASKSFLSLMVLTWTSNQNIWTNCVFLFHDTGWKGLALEILRSIKHLSKYFQIKILKTKCNFWKSLSHVSHENDKMLLQYIHAFVATSKNFFLMRVKRKNGRVYRIRHIREHNKVSFTLTSVFLPCRKKW